MSADGRRYLDPTEAFHASIDWSGSYSAVCTGPVDADALARAVDALAARVPLLRTRLERDDRGFRFHTSPGWRPAFRIREGGAQSYVDEMRRPPDPARSLARLTLIPGAPDSYVVMALHHAIADASAGLAVFGRLWQAYKAVVNGEPVPLSTVDALPPSAERVLMAGGAEPAGGTAAWEESAGTVCRALADRAGAFTLPATVADRVRLRVDATERLLAHLGDVGLTLNGFVCGVVLSAYRDEFRPGGEPVRLVCGSPVDVRGWVSPPVEPLAATNFVVGIEFTVCVPGNADPAAVARQAGLSLDAVLAALAPEAMLLDPRRFSGEALEVVDLAVSNVGRIPEFDTPEQMRITDFRGYPSAAVPGLLLHLVSLYRGRLSIDVLSPQGMLTDDQRRRLVHRIGRPLREAMAGRI